MSQVFKKSYNVKLPKSQHAVEEFGAHKGLTLCDNCGAVYFRKHWHHGLEKLNNPEMAAVVKSADKKTAAMKFILCPACALIKNGQYEGRLVIKNVLPALAGELEKLINGFCRRAYEIDPMDRLIAIKKSGSSWEVTLTENEMANKLANKIKSTFGRVSVKKRFLPEPSDVAEVTIDFQK